MKRPWSSAALVLVAGAALACKKDPVPGGEGKPPASRPVPEMPAAEPEAVLLSPLPEAVARGLGLDPQRPHEVQACTFEADEKPSGASPAHRAFRAKAAAPPEPCEVPALSQPGLYLFPAEAFGDVLPGAAAALGELRRALAERPETLSPPPFVPFVDASWAVAARVAYVDVEGGAGVLFLGELSIEPDTVGTRLVWVFQALSRSGEVYVLGLFPARWAGPVQPFDPGEVWTEKTFAEHERYLRAQGERLGRAPASDLQPAPEALRAALAGLSLR